MGQKEENRHRSGDNGKVLRNHWVQKFIKRSDENKEPHSHPKSTDTPREYRPYHSTWNGETNSFCLVIKDKKDLWGLWISNYIRLPFYVEFNWVLCDDIYFLRLTCSCLSAPYLLCWMLIDHVRIACSLIEFDFHYMVFTSGLISYSTRCAFFFKVWSYCISMVNKILKANTLYLSYSWVMS